MILGLFLNAMDVPIIPIVLIALSVIVQLGGFAFLIYRARVTKSIDALNAPQLDKITHIVGLVFVIYAALEIIGAFACVTANEICRGPYHYPINTNCRFCTGNTTGKSNIHTGVSDILMIGIYYNAFIVNSYVIAAIKTVKDFLDEKKIHLL